MRRLRNVSRAPILSGLSILALAVALSCFPTIWAQDQNVYEVGKEGDAPDPPTVTPLTEREICGDWKAEKIGDNESPVDDLYIYYGEKGFTFEGKYKDWQGSATATTETNVTVRRKPKADEMSDKAPLWAREKVEAEGKLEWKLSLKAESQKGEWVLEGKWYPGQFKWSEDQWSETGEANAAGRQASYLDEGKPVDVKFKKVPTIVGDPIVLNNQTGFNKGVPWHPYPYIFRPPAGTVKTESHSLIPAPGGDSRTLFVCGVNLPTNYSGKIDIRGSDKTVSYRLLALATDTNLNSDRKRLLKVGWDAALKGLDRDTEKTVRKCAAMLIRADLETGVVPGVKNFTLNNMAASWRLRFGDDGGLLTFARDITPEENEDIDCACLPEKIYIEIRTETAFPTQEIPLRVQLNDKGVKWNGSDTIVAKYFKDVPTPEAYEVPRAGEAAELVPKVIRVYRTAPITVSAKGTSGGNGYHLTVKPEDVLEAQPEDPYLFTLRPRVAQVKMFDGPNRDAAGKPVGTWQETIEKAAILDGLGEKVKAGKNVAGSEAASISNVVVTNIAFGKLRPLKDAWTESTSHWTSLFPMALPWRFFFGNRGIFTERVSVTVADHAALLLFKEAFIRKMSMGLDGLEKKTKAQTNPDAHRAMLLGLREMLKKSAAKESSPWESIRVPGPDGGDVKMSWALDDGLRKAACKGCSDGRADDWSLEAVENGLNQYKDAIKHAIQKAKDTPDNDVKKLIELIGYGYENLAPEVVQHMMWHGPPDDPTVLWQPQLSARYALWNLHTAADAIRAQEDLSKLDTQMVMLAASAFAAPFMLSENLFINVACYAFDVATFGGQLITETVPELWEQYQREEIRFAIGASLILGTDRLNEAELKRTEWFQTVLNVLPSALGVSMGAEALHGMPRATAKAKSSLTHEMIHKHGLEGAKHLTTSEKTAFLVAASEAEMLKEMGAAKVMVKSQEQAAELGEKIAAEAGVTRKARAEAKTNIVKATGNPEAEAKAATAEVKYTPDEEKAVKSVEVQPVSASSETKEPVVLPDKAAPVKKGTGTVEGADALAPAKQQTLANLKELEEANNLRVKNGQNPDEHPLEFPVVMPDNKEEIFGLGQRFGKGSTALVYDVVAGKFKDAVAKFFYRGDSFRTPGGIASDQVAISKRLTEGNVPHLKVREVPGCQAADPPFVIQDRLPPDIQHFVDTPADSRRVAEFLSREGPGGQLDGPGEAVAKLQRRLVDIGYDAEDLGWTNVYWIGSDEKGWTCAILDVDHILPHGQRNTPMGKRIDWIESEITRETVPSLFASRRAEIIPRPPNNEFIRKNFTDVEYTAAVIADEFIKRTPKGRVGPYFPNAEFFAEKMFEHKGLLKCDLLDELGNVTNSAEKAASGRLKDGAIKLKHVEKYFPNINDPARFKPLDLRAPFQSPGAAPGGSLREVPAWIRRISESSRKQFFTRPSPRRIEGWFEMPVLLAA